MSKAVATKRAPQPPLTHRLLLRVHSPTTAASIHASKFLHKPLRLLSTDPVSKNTSSNAATGDARALRRQHRLAKATAERERRRQKGKGRGSNSIGKPQPLSAAEKRKLGVYDISKQEAKQWDVYQGLNKLWVRYIREILGVSEEFATGSGTRRRELYVQPQNAGALLASADFHGADLEVARCRCVGRVGVQGIVVRDTKFTFVVVTEDGELKTLPKEHTIFRFTIPLGDKNAERKETAADEPQSSASQTDRHDMVPTSDIPDDLPKALVFELHGEQFKNRAAPDRAKKQFKMHLPPDL